MAEKLRMGALEKIIFKAPPQAWGAVVYDFTTTRSRAAPQKWLGKYQGYLQADGYIGHKPLYL